MALENNYTLNKRKCKKAAYNTGSEYVKDGIIIPKREMGAGCSEMCRKNCLERISYEDRKLFFEKFWATGDATSQRRFIASHMAFTTKKTQTLCQKRKDRRSNCEFFMTSGKHNISVCKSMFVGTLGISRQRIVTVQNKLCNFENLIDQRGRDRRLKLNETKKQIFETVRKHVNTILNAKPQDLNGDQKKPKLVKKRLYRQYQVWAIENCKHLAKPASFRQYYTILSREYPHLNCFIPEKVKCVNTTQLELENLKTEKNLDEPDNSSNVPITNQNLTTHTVSSNDPSIESLKINLEIKCTEMSNQNEPFNQLDGNFNNRTSFDNLPMIYNPTNETNVDQNITYDDPLHVSSSSKECDDLKMEIDRLKRENDRLNLENTCFHVQELQLEKMFTKRQLNKLKRPWDSIQWQPEDLNSAFELYQVSSQAYQYLLEKKNFPLPSLSLITHPEIQHNNDFESDTTDFDFKRRQIW